MKNSSSNNLILPKYLRLVKKKGSSLALPANGLGGSRATSSLVAHFALQNTASNSAEKKNRPSEGVAEGGFGGNSAFPLRNQIEASHATCLNTWKAEHHRKILFSLKEEKIGRAQNKKSKEYFSVVWRARRAVAGLASLLGVLLKKCSNFVQKTPPSFTFCENWRCAFEKIRTDFAQNL
ncbi:hypothetical protein KKB84_07200 [bacterium]|nr:hypothetical protein [bacterium]